jgi:phosphatidylserine/phosphatidylglycerophosphate/cardiolipin synthase-like enzyme
MAAQKAVVMSADANVAPTADRLIVDRRERRSALIEVIRGARRTIALSLFRCNDRTIFAELAAAVARGVTVDVLVTSRSKGGRKRREKLWNALEASGASVHAYKDPVVKYHAKYLVVDDGPAIVASLNFTRKCFKKTWDALVVTHDPAVVSGLKRLMAADCEEAPLPSGLSSRLIVGPECARRQLTALIEQAKTSIRIVDAKLSDPDLVDRLKRRRADGIDVEIYGEKRIGAFKSHGKIILIDDATLVVGSLALAALSLDFRREVAIAVTAPAAIAEAVQLFATLDAVRSDAGVVVADAAPVVSC